LSATINASQTSIPLTNTAKFAAAGGYALIRADSQSPPGEEIISYTGKSASELTGVTRGVDGTTATNGEAGDPVEERIFSQHHNALSTAVQQTSQDVSDLATGTENFAQITLSGSGSEFEQEVRFTIDSRGNLNWDWDRAGVSPAGGDVYWTRNQDVGSPSVGPGDAVFRVGFNDSLNSYLESSVGVAGQFLVFTDGNMDVSTEAGFSVNPGVADGTNALMCSVKSINDLDDATARNFKVWNQTTEVFSVNKSYTNVPTLKCSNVRALVLPVTGSILAASGDTGEIHLFESGGTREIRVAIGGVMYKTALTTV
jgi:hypothetical protein